MRPAGVEAMARPGRRRPRVAGFWPSCWSLSASGRGGLGTSVVRRMPVGASM